MAITHTLNRVVTYTTGGQVFQFSDSKTLSNELEEIVDETISQSASDQLVALSLDVSQCKMIMMSTDGALTVETNNATTPTDTFSFPAGGATIWWWKESATLDRKTLFLTADVTALYCTEPGTGDVQLRIAALLDSTP